MSLAAAIRKMGEYGLTVDQIADLCAILEAPAAPTALEKRRAYDRERKAKKKAESGNSTGIPPENSADNSTGIPPEFHRKTPPLARVEDNPLRVIPLDTAAVVVSSVTAWPDGSAGEWATTLVDLAASPRLSPMKHPGLTLTLGELVRWRTAGASWEFDVIPVVTTLARKQGPPIASWKFFSPAIAQSIADNRKALDIPEARHERPDTPSAKRAAREDNLERGFRVGLAVAGP